MLKFFSGILLVICIYLVTIMYYEKQQLLVPEKCISENIKKTLFTNFKESNTFKKMLKNGIDFSSINNIYEISFDKEKHIRLCQANIKLTNDVTIQVQYTIETRVSDIVTPILYRR